MNGLYYFGCIGQPGHYYWRFIDGRPVHVSHSDQPGPWGDSIDSRNLYPLGEHQGHASVHYKDGWTALCINDRTGDSRPGSHSAFITEGHLSGYALLSL